LDILEEIELVSLVTHVWIMILTYRVSFLDLERYKRLVGKPNSSWSLFFRN